MRLILTYVLAFPAALVAAWGSALILARVTGRLDLWRNQPNQLFFFVWGIRSDSGSQGVTWEIAAALTRATGAFAAARLVFWALAVPPRVFFAVSLVALEALRHLRRLRLVGHVPMSVPSEIRSLHHFRAAAGIAIYAVVALVFIRL